ncbi:MAG: hypothetical protein U5K28_13320 [Halobacteriales archaeon]|nr:hypothetical protein [Halobacteriales archaeon]
MIVRLTVATLLTAALLGVGLPAAETAHSERAATLAHDELTEFRETAARFYIHNDATRPDIPGASRRYTLRVPDSTTVWLGVGPRNERLRWQHDAHEGHVETDLLLDGSLRLDAGSHRLRLRLVRTDDGNRIRVARFKSDAEATG